MSERSDQIATIRGIRVMKSDGAYDFYRDDTKVFCLVQDPATGKATLYIGASTQPHPSAGIAQFDRLDDETLDAAAREIESYPSRPAD